MASASTICKTTSAEAYWAWAAPIVLALAGLAVYAGSLQGPWIFDDVQNIVENDAVQRPELYKFIVSGGRRPVAFASFALNQAIHGSWPPGYRATNVALHILAAIVLFDLIRITLPRTSLGQRHAELVLPAALTAALLFVVHPLATQAVTYIVQRMESLAALFYLATLWGLARGILGSRGWLALSLLCCWLGMATKETAATLPLAALLFDRIYFATSWRGLWQRRWAYYLAIVPMVFWLASGVLPALHTASRESSTVGIGIAEASPGEYLRSQAGVILHYLHLVFWPGGQCFDYQWPVATAWHEWFPHAVAVSLLLLGTALLLWRWPRIGFLPAMFWLVLVPSSSFVPIRDLAVEHRMYLPLAILAAAVVSLILIGAQFAPSSPRWAKLGLAGLLIVAVCFAGATISRNRVYQSEATLWNDVLDKAPHNSRAHFNLALWLERTGQMEAAIDQYRAAWENSRGDRTAVRAQILAKYGVAVVQQGDIDAGLALCEEGARLHSHSSEIQVNLGVARATAGNDEGAIQAFQQAIAIRADRVQAHYNLGQIAQRMGKFDLAVHHLSVAQKLDPTLPQIHERVAHARLRQRIEASR
jgi:tetratricopeptide (TPR) repeat protein